MSLDHLDPATFSRLTRGGDLAKVLSGIEAAQSAGMTIKINTVVLRQDNLAYEADLTAWAHRHSMDITFIEVMPMGEIGADRFAQHVPMPEVRARLEDQFNLTDVALRTGGPARYARTESGGTIGFLTPLSAKFCEGCNRVRVSPDGLLHACLGQTVATDLKQPLRASGDDDELDKAIADLIAHKPKEHDFSVRAGASAVPRPMAATGG